MYILILFWKKEKKIIRKSFKKIYKFFSRISGIVTFGHLESGTKICYIFLRPGKSIWKGCRGMNEKFFDLKKEKQDRMINASLKVFAMNGYAHASTDDIVREAGISKGLLFHYFASKLGLYSFIYDYSIRYVILELTTGVDKEETDYFRLVEQIKEAELQVMRNYPCMILFLNNSRLENVSEVLVETEDKRNILSEKYAQILSQATGEELDERLSREQLSEMICFTTEGLMRRHFFEGSFQPELYHQELKQYLGTMRLLGTRKTEVLS